MVPASAPSATRSGRSASHSQRTERAEQAAPERSTRPWSCCICVIAMRMRFGLPVDCSIRDSCGVLLFSWLQYYLQFASEGTILFLDRQGKAEMLDTTLMLVVGSIAADPI